MTTILDEPIGELNMVKLSKQCIITYNYKNYNYH